MGIVLAEAILAEAILGVGHILLDRLYERL